MTIEPRKVQELVALLKRRYPKWTGFKDPDFAKDEITYKRDTIARAQKELSADELKRLLEAGEFGEFISRLDAIGKDNNLLYRAVPMSGDLGILYQPNLDKAAFCRAVFDLLHGPDAGHLRLTRYTDFVKTAGLPNKWTFPTYFLFVCHPESEMFIKPRTTRWFVEFAADYKAFASTPTPFSYVTVKQLAEQLLTDLREFGPSDMVDIQGFIWVCASLARQGESDSDAENADGLPEPFASIFQDKGEAEWAFGFLRETAERLGVKGLDDPRVALTLPKGRDLLRLNFGQWLIVSLFGPSATTNRAEIALLTGLVDPPAKYSAFARGTDEPEVCVCEYSIESVRAMDAPLRGAWNKTLDFIAAKFRDWEGSPFRNAHQPELFQMVFDEEKQKQCLAKGLDLAEAQDAPVEDTGGAMALAESGTQKKGARFARWMGPILDALRSLGGAAPAKAVLQRIQERTLVPDASFTEILASGQTRFYNEVHWARQELVWEGLVDCPERGKWTLTVRGQHTNLDEPEAQKIVGKWAERHRQKVEMGAEQPPLFTAKTFELLAGLHETPKKEFYAAHKSEFKEHLEEPFRRLFESVRERVREEIRECMETEKKVFSRILKNDYGVGGAWEFLWGAFYPKGGERTKDVQLWVSMHGERVEAGFSFGEYSREKQKTFLANLAKHSDALASLLEAPFSALGLFYGSRDELEANAGDQPRASSFTDWASQIDDLGASLRVLWPKNEVLEFSASELSEKVANLFNALFPLVLLAIEEDPLPAIQKYLMVAPVAPAVAAPPPPPPQIQPVYPLATCAAETGFDVPTLDTWVRAVKRKGQAIIYGPPGTGKTFMAEKLAAHLIGGGDGFSELVQFHPAYAYEDFMQGLRPQTNGTGGLHYPLVPGRFLEFCKEAATRTGICVLVIDEINRANLARVFGELMFLLEYRKRDIPLAGGGKFKIPENVRLIGTMNTADRSIALVDHALRRRFAFIALYPRYEVLREFHTKQDTGFATDGLIEQLKKVNEAIDDRHYHIGVSFFLRPDLATQLCDIWQMEIEPYLEEYFFDQPEKLAQFRWDKVKANVLS